MRRRLIEAVGLVLAGGLVGVAGSELFLRTLRPQIFDIHPPGMYTEHPELGYVLTPDFEGTIQRSEFATPVRIGGGGLRGWEAGDKAPGGYRILVLGDSQTFGFGVRDEETLTVRLGELLQARFPQRAIEVINAGVPGYGTADQLAWLKLRGEELQPDLIIVQFLSVNDLLENTEPASSWAIVDNGMLSARERTQNTAGDSGDTFRRWQRYLKQRSHLWRLVSNTVGYWAIRVGLSADRAVLWGEDFSAEEAELGERLLEELADVAAEQGARTLFLYTTGQAHVLTGSSATLASRKVLETAADSAGVPWIDVSAELAKRADKLDLHYKKDGHWTPQGHAAVAEVLADYLAATLFQSDRASQRDETRDLGGSAVN